MKTNSKSSTGGKPIFEIQTISPAEAAAILTEQNQGNRPIAQARVDHFVTELRAGRFVLSNDAITFDEQGVLTNGQHRLSAVVQAQVPAEFACLYGVPTANRSIFDMGRKRSVADQLQFAHGIPQAKDVASICGVLDYVFNDSYQRQITVHAVLEMRACYRTELDWMLGRMGPHRPFFTHSSVLAALVVARSVVPEETEKFHDDLLRPTNVPASHSAVIKLRDWGMERGGGKANRVGTFHRTLNALVSYVDGIPLRSLTAKTTGFDILDSGCGLKMPTADL